MKNKLVNRAVLLVQLLLIALSINAIAIVPINSIKENSQIDLRQASVDYTNVTCISDGFGGTNWNDDHSEYASIAVDGNGNVHAVWNDATDGPWGSDKEILHSIYNAATGEWSNVTCVSDGYNSILWNSGDSEQPSIAVDGNGNVHAVWSDTTDGPWGSDVEILHAVYNAATGVWSNATCVSDSVEWVDWNDDSSYLVSIAVDGNGNAHAIWEDYTDGPWGSDVEILHAIYNATTEVWSNATCVSDSVEWVDWNTGYSGDSSLAVDGDGNAHAIWGDYTDGPWGSDAEILHAIYNAATGVWSNATCVSDSVEWVDWNKQSSDEPSIAVDGNGYAHAVWYDQSNGPWGNDMEILYSIYNPNTGDWSNVTCISDGFNGTNWNNGDSYRPVIAVDGNGNIQVVWEDYTDGPWGSDIEILHVVYNASTGSWSNVTCISDGFGGINWNNDDSECPSIIVDNSGNAHVIWHDETIGPWGGTGGIREIFYVKINAPPGSGGIGGPNNIPIGNFYVIFAVLGILSLVVFIKSKNKTKIL